MVLPGVEAGSTFRRIAVVSVRFRERLLPGDLPPEFAASARRSQYLEDRISNDIRREPLAHAHSEDLVKPSEVDPDRATAGAAC